MSDSPFTWPDRRQNDRAHQQLTAFLVMDVQQSSAWAEDLLNQLDAIESGHIHQWERIGNAFRLELSATGATLEDLVDEQSPVQQISLKEFRSALLAWCQQVVEQEIK